MFGKGQNGTVGIKNSYSMHRLTCSTLDIDEERFYELED